MNNKQLALYLRRIVSTMKDCYDDAHDQLVDIAPRVEHVKLIRSAEQKAKIAEWEKTSRSWLAVIPEELRRTEDMDQVIEYGEIIALDKFDTLITELEEDIDALMYIDKYYQPEEDS